MAKKLLRKPSPDAEKHIDYILSKRPELKHRSSVIEYALRVVAEYMEAKARENVAQIHPKPVEENPSYVA